MDHNSNNIITTNFGFNFLFSSITFLPLYVPLIIELNLRNIQINFFWRSNKKGYADPMKHKKQWDILLEKLKINILHAKDLDKYHGILICVDGDIYGPHQINIDQSCLHKINRDKYIVFSLTENLNFKWAYPHYSKLIDYLIVPNINYTITYNLNKTSNLYLGSPKFDIIFNKERIYSKYRLKPNDKYVLIFYPRMGRGITKYGKKFPEQYYNLYAWLHKLGYKIIVKNRDKNPLSRPTSRTNSIYKEDYYFNDITLFPSTSLELLQISEIAFFFGSSVIEEIVMSKVPYVEFTFDNVNRFEYLRHPSYQYLITSTNFPTESEFNTNILKLIANKPNYHFDQIIKQYLFQKEGCTAKIIDQILDLYQQKYPSNNLK